MSGLPGAPWGSALIVAQCDVNRMSLQITPSSTAPVFEVFASFQGEGLYAGSPQVFLRLAGCPLRCAWCDTPASWETSDRATARVRTREGVRQESAWATPAEVVGWIDEVDPTGRMTVSVTGGEPLIWPEFLLELRPLLGRRRVHLETAGAHPRSLGVVLDACDHVSADLKLPEDMGPPEFVGFSESEPCPTTHEEWRTARRSFLESICGRDACCKLVVAGGRAAHAYAEILADVAECAPELVLFLQPATPVKGIAAPASETLSELATAAEAVGLRARVLGQLHRAWGLP